MRVSSYLKNHQLHQPRAATVELDEQSKFKVDSDWLFSLAAN